MSETDEKIFGYDARAYALRSGYSPEHIRDALWSLIREQLGGVVLDAGSGEGGWVRRLQAGPMVKRIISVDIVANHKNNNRDVEFHRADLSSDVLPCDDNELDWIFAVEVLEHLANPRHFVKEALRCLKPSGKLVLTTPCNDSLTAKLSFLFRGYFPAFCEHDYQGSGHITPITELDLKRVAQEAGFGKVEFFYPLNGRMPKTAIQWQKVLPFLRGKLWSDSLFAVLTK